MYIQSTCIKRSPLGFLDKVMFVTMCEVTFTLDKNFEIQLYDIYSQPVLRGHFWDKEKAIF